MKKIIPFILAIALFSCSKDGSADRTFASTPTGQGGSLARFTIVGNFLYTVDRQDLKVFDITDAAHPVYKRAIPVGFDIETIFPFKDKLFIGSATAVHIFSIDDPANPQKLSIAISPTVMRRCDPVVAKDTVAYATLRTNGPCGGTQSILAVYNIKDVTNPVQATSVPVGEPYGLGYTGNTLYVCDRMYGLMVFDITQAYNPRLVKQVPGVVATDVIPYNDVLICWTATGMTLYDITSKQDPVLLTQIN